MNVTEMKSALTHIQKVEKKNMEHGFAILPVPKDWRTQPTLSFISATEMDEVLDKLAENPSEYKGKGIPKAIWDAAFIRKNGMKLYQTKETFVFALMNTLSVAINLVGAKLA